MSTDLIRGATMRWTFDDGPMKGHSYEHVFASDGTVTFRQLDAGPASAKVTKAEAAKPDAARPDAARPDAARPDAARPTGDKKPAPIHYELAEIHPDTFAVSYLSPSSGYTLTSVLDLRAGTVVSFASNAKELSIQHGTIDAIDRPGRAAQ